MESLRTAIGDVSNLVFVSDRHSAIGAAIAQVFSLATYCYCTWHLSENLKKSYHRADIGKIFYKASRAYTQRVYEREMNELKSIHSGAYCTTMEADPRKWARAHCPKRRYNVMTTNIAESMNSCLRFTRQLPVMTLAEFIRNML